MNSNRKNASGWDAIKKMQTSPSEAFSVDEQNCVICFHPVLYKLRGNPPPSVLVRIYKFATGKQGEIKFILIQRKNVQRILIKNKKVH